MSCNPRTPIFRRATEAVCRAERTTCLAEIERRRRGGWMRFLQAEEFFFQTVQEGIPTGRAFFFGVGSDDHGGATASCGLRDWASCANRCFRGWVYVAGPATAVLLTRTKPEPKHATASKWPLQSTGFPGRVQRWQRSHIMLVAWPAGIHTHCVRSYEFVSPCVRLESRDGKGGVMKRLGS